MIRPAPEGHIVHDLFPTALLLVSSVSKSRVVCALYFDTAMWERIHHAQILKSRFVHVFRPFLLALTIIVDGLGKV